MGTIGLDISWDSLNSAHAFPLNICNDFGTEAFRQEFLNAGLAFVGKRGVYEAGSQIHVMDPALGPLGLGLGSIVGPRAQ